MADNLAVTPGSGATVAADDIGGILWQRVKLGVGADGSATDVSSANPMPVGDASGSLTVDAPVGTPVYVRLSDGASPITTLPVSAASLPLPSGASTAAKQPALGTAGTPSADVISIQGVASGTTVPVSDGGGSLTVDNAGTFAVQLSQYTPATGRLPVDGSGVTQPVSVAATVTVTGPLTDTQLRASAVPVSLASVPSHAVTNAGTFATQDSQTLADNAGFTDGTSKLFMVGYIYDEVAGTALTENDAAAGRINVNRAQIGVIEDGATRARYATVTAANALKIDGSAVTQPVSAASLPLPSGAATESTLGTLNGKVTACNTGAVTISAALPTGTNVVGRVGIDQTTPGTTNAVQPIPGTSGGLSLFRSLDLDETEEDIKTSAGQLYGYYLFNAAASTRYVKIYNATAASVVVGTTTPVLTIPLPAGAAANVEFTQGLAFGTAICAAATTGVADTDTGAPAANDVVANFFFK